LLRFEGELVNERISHELLASRVASELGPGQVVSLGTGLPALVAGYVPDGMGVILHSENGVLGYAPGAAQGGEDPADAAGGLRTFGPGGAIVDQADSFGIIRGGYVDVAVVEARQVSRTGDLAACAPSAGATGADSTSIDIAAGAKYLIAMMEHTDDDGATRIVTDCSHTIAGQRCVNLIITDVAVIEVASGGLLLREIAPGWKVEEVQAITGATLTPSSDIKEMEFGQPPRRQPEGGALSKIYSSGAHALADIPDGAVVMMDGFAGPGGMSQYLLVALRDQGARDLTIISNTAGIARATSFGTPPGFIPIDHSILVDNGQVKKAVASFPVSPRPSRPSSFELAYRQGKADLELVPQGTLAERIRAGGYGIGGFYTPTGVGTQIAEGKETRIINGREYVLEYGIRADYALLRAHKADRMGNLVYRGTSRNFNAVMAPAADITIVEVDEIVEVGELDPDAIVTPGVFVQRIVARPPDFLPYEQSA
jgi:3-oxoadipate CoA-transferase alpha subunit